MDLGDKKILVLGLGLSGVAAAELALSQNASVIALDSGNTDSLRDKAAYLRRFGAEVILDCTEFHSQTAVDLAVISPGIPAKAPLGQIASSLQCPVVSELAFAARFCQCPILAITGTNGKTTTVELTVHCLQESGLKVCAAGNCGYPLSTATTESINLDWLVVEVSSFQLERAEGFSPYGAACLNVSSDHQDRYQDFSEYILTKRKLIRAVDNPAHTVLGCSLLQHSEFRNIPHSQPGRPLVFCCSPMAEADFTCGSDGIIRSHDGSVERQLIHRSELGLQGNHNVENVMAALALCRIAGIDDIAAAKAATSFKAGEHRFELVGEENGIRFINDSKATNPDAVVQALKACFDRSSGHVVLIAGGRDKAMQFDSVKPWLKEGVSKILLLGETREYLQTQWQSEADCELVDTLDNAVDRALALANPGDTVLLSPGCASQDMFSDYAQRGKQFKNALNRRLGKCLT